MYLKKAHVAYVIQKLTWMKEKKIIEQVCNRKLNFLISNHIVKVQKQIRYCHSVVFFIHMISLIVKFTFNNS